MFRHNIRERICLIAALAGGLFLFASASARADFNRGWQAYQNGDYATASQFWTSEARRGNARAQYNLGVMYDRGLGVSRAPEIATNWWRRAAELGHTGGQHNLALILIERGGDEDLREAVGWLEAAAAAEFVRSQYTLGKLYESGLGVAPDSDRAFVLVRAAAETGFVRAQYTLGKMYRDGTGTPTDLTAAAMWFKRAADQGYAKAQSRLATRYLDGEGVAHDAVEALKWLLLASRQGYEPADQLRWALLAEMTAQEIAEAERRAADFQPSPE